MPSDRAPRTSSPIVIVAAVVPGLGYPSCASAAACSPPKPSAMSKNVILSAGQVGKRFRDARLDVVLRDIELDIQAAGRSPSWAPQARAEHLLHIWAAWTAPPRVRSS